MKRYLILFYFVVFGLSLGFGQSAKIIDDIYVTPNDAQMINEIKTSRQEATNPSAVYRNGAREIVFIDQYGNKTTAVSDTVYIVTDELTADSIAGSEKGYYLNGFQGSRSDYEYAERIRRFHNPRYTITIADPGYNDIYFLDNNYWNVYVDGMYATITPTWNNPYSWNYQYAPYSYNNWAWRHNWGYPSWGRYGWGSSYYGWYDPWYSPWYGGYYGSYYGWGGGYYGYGWGGGYGGWGYPYYGGYYGWGGGYGYGWGNTGYYSTYNANYDQSNRRAITSERYNASGARSDMSRRTGVMSAQRSTADGYTRVTTSSRSSVDMSGSRRSADMGTVRTSTERGASGVDTRTRTGTVRSTTDWNNARSGRSYSSDYDTYGRSSSGVINRSSPSSTTRSSSGTSRGYETGRSTSSVRSERSNTYSRSSTYSAPSSRSSSSGSYGGGSSSGGGGGRSSSGSSSGTGTRR